jgi:KAP family P-loop domain
MGAGTVPHEPKQPESPPEVARVDANGYRLLLDVPAHRPALGFPRAARALAQIVSGSKPQFAIGIFGGWGSGKTTLMRAIEDELDSERVLSVQFSAWRYEREEHLIVPLLDTIREALVAWSEKNQAGSEAAKKTAATVGRATTSILAGLSLRIGIPHAIEMSFDANKALQAGREFRKEEVDARVPRSFYHASFLALSDAFAEFVGENRRIVVFVDDLDRCLPEKALQVLESMKLFFDLHGFVFVVGLDQEIVELVIDLKYGSTEQTADGEPTRAGRMSGADYVKKVFQLEYRLAPVAVEQLKDFLATAYAEARLPHAQQDELRACVERHLPYVVGDSGVNPREIKRYINAYTLKRMIGKDLDADVILTLQTIASRRDWSELRAALLAYGRLFVEALHRSPRIPLEILDPRLVLPDEFLDYIDARRPGHSLLKIDPGEIDKYIYSGEAVRTPQDAALLKAIQSLGEASRLLTEAKRAPIDKRKRLFGQSLQAFKGPGTYFEFGFGSLGVRDVIYRDWVKLMDAVKVYLQDPKRLEDLQEDVEELNLEELNRLARSISDRLLRIYRKGEAPSRLAGL